MITYVYACENCDVEEFELMQSIHSKPKVRCPVCKMHKLYRVIQPTQGIVRLAFSELKTLGQIADRNSSRMSDDEKFKKARENRTKKVIPNRLPDHLKPAPRQEVDPKDVPDKSLATLTPEQTEKYIVTGKK